MDLREFVCEWNVTHGRLTFSPQWEPIIGRPTEIAIRYSAAKFKKLYSTEKWNELKTLVEAKSHNTMYVTTDERLFERGIVDIKVASQNHNYQDRLVTGVLRWIGEEFFTNKCV